MKTVTFCEFCRNEPAEKVLLQSASSRILWWNHRKIQALLCGICAERVYYDLQSRNLIQGWWGPLSALATSWFSLSNIVRIRKHRAQVPFIVADGKEYVRVPLNARNNLAAIFVTGVFLFGIGYIVTSGTLSESSVSNEVVVGDCYSEDTESNLTPVPCDSSEADWEVTGVIANKYYCPLNDYFAVGDNFACLKPVY